MRQAESLYKQLHDKPFHPFRLHLADGRVFEIRNPETNMVGESWIRIGVFAPRNTQPDPLPDHSVKVPLALILRVESLPEAASTPSHG